MKKIRVLVFDDHQHRRESLQLLISNDPELQFTAAYEDCSDVIDAIEAHQPDVILMDIQMPNVDGLEGLRMIRIKYPGVRVIMQTVFEDDDKVFSSLQRGASGYILKKTDPSKVIDAIKDVMDGGAPITPSIAAKVLTYFSAHGNFRDADDYNLTEREKEILGNLVKGLSYKMIATKLGISFHTVNNHVRKVYEKLEVHSQSEAVSKTLREKLITVAAIIALAFQV
jgi:DNA-binding NarL/FixJ family response regulator